ncbi:MAG: fimbrial protein pilin [Candidatus Wolfebacteria bacterium GW2011_GWC2_39_22]|uniref:Fimbrial protein pilin n=1 Tax=Candidatus Wolfebacteria bacterium GW2011_GWC2_39_22 TaxID=1619013 RepID=A0A0G0RGF7_9BACT|nr:MAG: fimbrial protein pilin [Candidatus Wolfebacteria bacterium GW2011_GWC2_39_22]HBI25616.1 hypothetical protein [Candidatus Wolfebacteria bacterium]
MKSQLSQKGFTLVEMLIVIAIIAILASVSLVSVGGVRKSARDTKRVSDISKIQQQLEVFYSINGAYPATAAFATFTTDANFNDPLNVAYSYGAYSNNQKYVLGAIMEGGTAAMNEASELDDDPSSTGITCADESFGYCIGN